jgi:predicted RNA-binding Zn-ribbon protein involved in translation (DUF1610 family)
MGYGRPLAGPEVEIAYLNCPSCRLTVYSPVSQASSEVCPRCGAKLGRVSRLFRSSLPARLLDQRGGSAPADRSRSREKLF